MGEKNIWQLRLCMNVTNQMRLHVAVNNCLLFCFLMQGLSLSAIDYVCLSLALIVFVCLVLFLSQKKCLSFGSCSAIPE